MNSGKTWMIGVIVLVVAIIIAVIVILTGWSSKPMGVQNIPFNQTPAGFPSSTPIISQISLLSNFNIRGATSTQAGKKFSSSMSPLPLFNLYKQFYSQTGWTLSDVTLDNVTQQGLWFYGAKGGDQVYVRIGVDPKSNKISDVQILYTNPN